MQTNSAFSVDPPELTGIKALLSNFDVSRIDDQAFRSSRFEDQVLVLSLAALPNDGDDQNICNDSARVDVRRQEGNDDV